MGNYWNRSSVPIKAYIPLARTTHGLQGRQEKLLMLGLAGPTHALNKSQREPHPLKRTLHKVTNLQYY
jgi:hypothetical protein